MQLKDTFYFSYHFINSKKMPREVKVNDDVNTTSNVIEVAHEG